MKEYEISLEETGTRLYYTTVRAKSLAEARQIAQAALENGDWTEWSTSDTDCHLELDEVKEVYKS